MKTFQLTSLDVQNQSHINLVFPYSSIAYFVSYYNIYSIQCDQISKMMKLMLTQNYEGLTLRLQVLGMPILSKHLKTYPPVTGCHWWCWFIHSRPAPEPQSWDILLYCQKKTSHACITKKINSLFRIQIIRHMDCPQRDDKTHTCLYAGVQFLRMRKASQQMSASIENVIFGIDYL